MNAPLDQNFTILAVDDEEFNLDLIELAFAEFEDVKILRAENGAVALDLLKSTEPDVILLDLAMPVLNGFDVLKTLKLGTAHFHLPIIVVTANPEEKNQALKLGANDFLAKPFDVDEMVLRTCNHARSKELHDYLQDVNLILEDKVVASTKQLQEALELAWETEREIAYRLGRAAEFRDTETGAHIRRMSQYSAKLAKLYGMSDAEMELILHSAPLHDIGKVGIPDGILLKPGRLTKDEFDIMRKHATIGAEMLAGCERFPLLKAGQIIAAQHHEKYDGSGYPDGLSGEDIHIYGRLVAVADVFDALTSKRVYKPAMPLDDVLALMESEKGKHFDPKIIDLLLDNLDDFLTIRDKYPDSTTEISNILELIGERN